MLADAYFDLRRNILRVIRMESPDTVITVNPWLAYEAHNDHIKNRFKMSWAEACWINARYVFLR